MALAPAAGDHHDRARAVKASTLSNVLTGHPMPESKNAIDSLMDSSSSISQIVLSNCSRMNGSITLGNAPQGGAEIRLQLANGKEATVG